MSDLDRVFLKQSGLTAAMAAELTDKTRQAISKGVASDKHYFSPGNLRELSEAVEAKMPDRIVALKNAINDMFDALSERLGGGGPDRNVAAAIAQAERIWLIFPRFGSSFEEQPDAYKSVFDAIAKREPGTMLRASMTPKCEVTVFCDRNRIELERRFDEAWFRQRQIHVIECEILEKMSPMIVVDPHSIGQNLCFGSVKRQHGSQASALMCQKRSTTYSTIPVACRLTRSTTI
jgi:hypothetical protein